MFDYAREAVDLAHGKTRNDLDADRMLNLALVRLLEIIGEAAGRIPTEDRESLSQIPWRGIIGMRNRLIHGYDQVDFDILWNIITRDIPPLITALEMALSDKHGGE
jgi:uncharacterized protein with HEPN domain